MGPATHNRIQLLRNLYARAGIEKTIAEVEEECRRLSASNNIPFRQVVLLRTEEAADELQKKEARELAEKQA